MVELLSKMWKPRPVGKDTRPAGSEQGGLSSRKSEDWQYEFNIFCSNKDIDGTILASVSPDQWVQHNSNTRVWYSSDNQITPIVKKEIRLKKPDLFYIVGLYDWNYNFKPLFHFKEIIKIISVRGMLHPGALSQKTFKKKIYLSAWKLLGWHRKYRFQVSDQTEMAYVKNIFGDLIDISVAGNFPLLHKKMELAEKKAGVLKIVSVCLISPMKNIRLILESLVWSRESGAVGSGQGAVANGQPGVASQESEVESSKLVIGRDEESEVGSLESGAVGSGQSAVGRKQSAMTAKAPDANYELKTANYIEYNIYGPVKDGRYWNDCLELIKKMPANVRVKYHGEIPPASVGDVLAKHHVFVLPSKSENYGHAIIEALSAGLPVITSHGTPWNGLGDAKAGSNVSTDDIIDLVDAIDKFAGMEQEEFEAWSNGAAEYARKAVNVEKTKLAYLEMFGVGG